MYLFTAVHSSVSLFLDAQSEDKGIKELTLCLTRKEKDILHTTCIVLLSWCKEMQGNCTYQLAELFHFQLVPCRSCCGLDPVLSRNIPKHRTLKCDLTVTMRPQNNTGCQMLELFLSHH